MIKKLIMMNISQKTMANLSTPSLHVSTGHQVNSLLQGLSNLCLAFEFTPACELRRKALIPVLQDSVFSTFMSYDHFMKKLKEKSVSSDKLDIKQVKIIRQMVCEL